MPPESLWLGDGVGGVSLPTGAVGATELELVRVEDERILVRAEVSGEPVVFRAIELGERHVLVAGEFTIEVSAEEAVVTPVRRFHARPGFLGYFAAAGAFLLGALGLLAAIGLSPSDPEDKEEIEARQLVVMRHYLLSLAEREREPEDAPREGGSGARAKGDDGSMGARFGIQGPKDASDPHANTEEFADHGVNPPTDPQKDRLSTFAIDVDTGSYALCKRMLNEGELPPLRAVRAEEFLNAFDYGYTGPEAQASPLAFDVRMDAVASPYREGRHFVRIGVQGRRIPKAQRKPVHLVYLVDTSGSMQSDDKLGLVKTSLRYLTESLRPGDTVALSTYAGDVREVLPPTPMAERKRILAAIDDLTSGGSTAMASGIDIAYGLAQRTLVRGEESRVVILSDGDANVGPVSPDEILGLIETRRKQGITLSTVGFGRGNYKDATMERLADAGDGNYSYIGSERDAKRVFAEQVEGLLQVIARDVKLQIEFDPLAVAEYRLIGYENRDVADRDFRNDDIDGGEVGSGHSVTALYEVVFKSRSVVPVHVTLRYKRPDGGLAVEQAFALDPASIADRVSNASSGLRFAVAVAGFAEILRGSPFALTWKLDDVAALAAGAGPLSADKSELVGLVKKAAELRANGT
jgi:Ca-activated chloride channel family protein